MFKKTFYLLSISLILITCKQEKEIRLSAFLEDCSNIVGKQEHLNSPYVTAGNKVYMIGHQDGSFPNLGWHIKGEMGGIWNHPIKLMDGFDIHIDYGDKSYPLNNATTFTNYPFANIHHFKIKEKNLSIQRIQFVPDNTEGIAIQLEIFNDGNTTQKFDLTYTGHSDLRANWLGDNTEMINGLDIATFNSNIDGWVVKDQNNPWFACYSASIQSDFHSQSSKSFDKMGTSNTLGYSITIKPYELKTILFVIAGSYTSEKVAITTLQTILDNIPIMLNEKKERYKKLANQTRLSVPNKKLEQNFEWLKYHSDWLVHQTPEIDSSIGVNPTNYPLLFGLDKEPFVIAQNDTLDSIALNNSNDPFNVLNNLKQITSTFNYALPSSIYELKSKYGIATQVGNNLSFAHPILNQLFDIQSNTVEKKIVIKPQIPKDWGEASLENVAIGDNTISIYFSQNKKSITIRALQTNWDWSFEVVLPRKHKNDGLSVRLGENASITNNLFKVRAINGEIDTAVYFQKNIINTD